MDEYLVNLVSKIVRNVDFRLTLSFLSAASNWPFEAASAVSEKGYKFV
jgi:hypothetical protein